MNKETKKSVCCPGDWDGRWDLRTRKLQAEMGNGGKGKN